MTIRSKLLLVSLVLLAIPLIGYGFVREMEKVLRAGQEQAVSATARAVATALHDRPKLLERRAQPPRNSEPGALPARAASSEIETIIKGVRRASARIWVIDRQRELLAIEGSLRESNAYEDSATSHNKPSLLQPLYRLILEPPRDDFDDALPEEVLAGGREVHSALNGIPATRWRNTTDKRAVVLSAAHPIWNGDEVVGAVIAEETTNAVVSLTNRALERLIAVTLAVFVFGAGTMFLFASSLSRRLRRLRNDAELAIDAHGRVAQHFRATRHSDEIGDLSRSFAAVLERLGEYTAYLERMADRLSHELRTPVAVVSSSLENLKSEHSPEAMRVYIERAEEGVKRLNLILTRIAEASRLEQMLRDAEREPFDLGRVVSGCVAGYTGAFPAHRFELSLPERRIDLVGAPDLIAQALDKLVENAMDFSTSDTAIIVAIMQRDDEAILSVSNTGPQLPETMQGQLFESMVSLRSGATKNAGAPHLGLGLFIVRLIAEFHHGRAVAHNRKDASGVVFQMVLPLKSV
ncbi:MAG TPA: ATP-binding protein [Burkholderiales bacterium]|nr:ATP-binding protein [Burkholderiales bacterium]